MTSQAYFIISNANQRTDAMRYIQAINSNNPLMVVEVKPYKRNRTQAQNRLYWMWLGLIASETGQDTDDIHEEMKVRVLGVEKRIVCGQPLIVPKSSAKLTVEEMTKFLVAIEALASELNIALQYPDDYGYCMGR